MSTDIVHAQILNAGPPWWPKSRGRLMLCFRILDGPHAGTKASAWIQVTDNSWRRLLRAARLAARPLTPETLPALRGRRVLLRAGFERTNPHHKLAMASLVVRGRRAPGPHR